jgi:hypothetical protein
MLFILMCIFLQYALSLLSIAYKRYNFFIIVYLCSIVFYDYLFINASYFLPETLLNLLKPYNEYLLVFLTFNFCLMSAQGIGFKHTNADKAVVVLLFSSLFVLLLNDFSTNINFGDTVNGLRMYLVPVFVPYLMYKANWFDKINFSTFLYGLFSISIVIVIYGTIQKNNFNGDLKSLWFYGFFSTFPENPVEVGFYNYIRNDVLRTTSFFVSPIIYSISVAIPAVYAVGALITKSSLIRKWFLILVILTSLYGLVIAETRVGLIILIIGAGILIVPRVLKKKYALMVMPSIPLFAVVLTFISLLYGFTEDLSALGRLVQYFSFFEYYKIFGLGFNNEYVLNYFDTYYMSIALLYGVLVVFPIYFFVDLNRFLYKAVSGGVGNDGAFMETTFAVSLTFIYSFAFQFTAGSYPYKVLFLIIFVVFARKVASHGK